MLPGTRSPPQKDTLQSISESVLLPYGPRARHRTKKLKGSIALSGPFLMPRPAGLPTALGTNSGMHGAAIHNSLTSRSRDAPDRSCGVSTEL
eukprot:1630383-Prymnesium_polylepis.1